jgi:ribosomal protein L37E
MAEVSEQREDGEEEDKATSFLKALQEDSGVVSAGTAAMAVDLLFPDFKCLRCGNEKFSVTQWSQHIGWPSKIDIVCQHCGMVESHLPKFLVDAARKLGQGSKNE